MLDGRIFWGWVKRTIRNPTEENTWAQLSILDKEELVVKVDPSSTLLTWLDILSVWFLLQRLTWYSASFPWQLRYL